MLNGKPEERELVKKVFSNVVIHETPSGAVSTNVPRVKHDQRLNPADLMVLLHEKEKEIGLKSAIEGKLRINQGFDWY
jgi:symplekin